jgi:O-acetyl-ADP-ribose deacetylase (regulator of RNase III)
MKNTQRVQFLTDALLDEMPQYRREAARIPGDAESQRYFLRCLMNVREPGALSERFLQAQDELLSREREEKGVVHVAELLPVPADERLVLWQGDITRLDADAIVNAANSALLGCFRPLHNCADNLIHSKAGLALRHRCSCIMDAQGHEEPTGRAKITPGYNLPCKYILHTVGPIVEGELTPAHERQLAACYTSCLELARENGLESVAFCCVSTGVFMFPNRRAAEIAVETVTDWLDREESRMKVIFNVYKEIDLALFTELLRE